MSESEKLVEEIINEEVSNQLEMHAMEDAKNQLMANILSYMGDDGSPSDFDVAVDGKWAKFNAEWDRVRNPGQVTITAPNGYKSTFTLNLK